MKLADLPAESLRKATFHHIIRGELASAYVAFSDYWERERPSVDDFNIIFAWLGASAQYSDLNRV